MSDKLSLSAICAKEKAIAGNSNASQTRVVAERKAAFPAFAWLGNELAAIETFRLRAACALVELHGEDPRGAEVARTLGISEQDVRERTLLADVERRAKRGKGEAPPGKPLEERKRYVAVRIALGYWARLMKPTPRLPDGTAVTPAAAALLAQAGVLETALEGSILEPHPRAKPRTVRKLDASRRRQIEAELKSFDSGNWGPGESRTPLPDQACAATRRNHRRAAEALEQFDAERRTYERQQKLERLAQKVGSRFNNPAGVKSLPLHEGRRARGVAREREKAAAFLKGLPHEIRVRLHDAATRGGERGRLSEEAMLVYAFYAYLLWQSGTARPSMQRSGYDRAVEGLSREALAVAFVWNAYFEAPYHANTISSLVKTLVDAGLIGREQPNGQSDVYTGTTGWALYVYRLRNGAQVVELAMSLGEDVRSVSADDAGAKWTLAGDAAS